MIETVTIPPCPNCGGTDWRFWEGGNYRSEYAIEQVGSSTWTFKRIDHDEDIESSYFYCADCELGNDTFQIVDAVVLEKWDKVNDQLHELRDTLDWDES